MSNAKLKNGLAPADLIRDLALAQEAREKRFEAIVRFIQRREASGSAKDMMAQIRRNAGAFPNQLIGTQDDYH